MSKFSLTLNFDTAEEMLDAAKKLAGTISHADRPDVGAVVAVRVTAPTPPTPPETPNLAAIFGNAPTVPPVMTPPPALPTPPATPGVAAVPAAPPKVDKTGLPWDARIHATNSEKTGGTMNDDGTWRKKRGLNDGALVARVEAELRAAATAGSPPTAATVPTVAPVLPAPPTPPAAVVPTPPVLPPAAAPTVPAAAPTGETFAAFMARIAPTLTSNPAAQGHLQTALLGAGLPGVGSLATRPDLIPSVSETFLALVAS